VKKQEWRSRIHTVTGTCASIVVLLLMISDVLAQPQTGARETAQAVEQRTFSIAPQQLGTALGIFGQQSGRQVTVDGAVVRGVSTPGVQGTMSIDEALRRLLAGTGLIWTFPSATTITLQRAAQGTGLDPNAIQLDPVQVQGFPVPQQAMIDNLPPAYAGGQVATGGQLGLLGNRDVMDTPFNQTSYTAKKIQDQQARTVTEVLVDDPSVRFRGVDSMLTGADVWIRGFYVVNSNIAFGGLYGMLPYYSTMAELAERVELLKGPSATLNGMPPVTSIGGTINVVPKRAPDEPLTQVTADYASVTQFGGHADLARRFGPDKQFGVRFNGVFRGGETAVEMNTDQRALASLGLDFRGERVRLSTDLGYQNQYIGGAISDLDLANGVHLPWAPDARKNQGGGWSSIRRKDAWVVARGEVDLTERITAYAAFGARDSRNQWETPATITILDFNGDATTQPRNLSFYIQNLTGEVGVRGLVDTGPVGHQFAVSATTVQQNYGVGFVFGTPYATNIYNPTYIFRPTDISTPQANLSSLTTLSSLGFADTLSAADKRIQLTVGARLQQVQAGNFDIATGAQTDYYDQSALSPSVSLVFKPWRNVSIYGNFIQGLQQGSVVPPNFTNAGEIFPPFKSTQYEAGVKVDWGKFTTTASVFQISQPSLITDVSTNTLTLGGEQRNQGLELNFFGEPMEGVRVLGGAMFLDAVLTKTQGGLTDGWTAPFSPGLQLNLAGEWDLPFARGLTLNGRVIYTASQYIDTTFPRRSLPDWTRFDLGARYTFDNARSPTGRPVVIRFNVENVLDTDYWAGGGASYAMYLGAPRTFRLALTSDF
jgi:iron complex outermembrane receptor protein